MAQSKAKQDAKAKESASLRVKILAALKANNAYRSAAAEALGMSLRTLHRHIQDMNLAPEILDLERKLGRRTWAPGRKATPLRVRRVAA